MMGKRILVVEDDASLARLIIDNLVYEGFVVDRVSNAADALSQIRANRPNLVLLDIMLPDFDGFELCRQLNATQERLAVIMVTARTQQGEKVHGLELGADDYVTKPFALRELLARIHAVLRRTQPPVKELSLGDVTVDFTNLRAWKRKMPLPMTAREFALLQHLAEHAGQCVTREELLRSVWGYSELPMTRTVDNFVARLRRRIEPDPHSPRFIRTVHGDGYTLTPGQ